MTKKELARELLDFIDQSPCMYYSTANMKNILDQNSFKEIDLSKRLEVQPGFKGYIVNNDSAIIAFKIGKNLHKNSTFRIAGSHTDSPSFRVKNNPVMLDENLIKLNTEVYGSPIYSTWMDKPLSLAGRVTIKGDDFFQPQVKLININKDLLLIPNLAIHMNREVNKGTMLNPQKHTLPILTINESKELDKRILEKLLCEELSIDRSDLLDYDLYLYDRQKGTILGLSEELISVGRQDNLSMAYTSLKAFVDVEAKNNINVFLSTDNEEVGSKSIQGADSPFIAESLERVILALGGDREDYLRIQENSFMVSADMAHSVHPNYTEKADPTNRSRMGNGVVIKYAANKSYSTDAYSASIIKLLCRENNIKYQEFYNRSDARGGSTIGPITASHLNIRSADLGLAILAMHSIRELGAIDDLEEAYKLFKVLYS